MSNLYDLYIDNEEYDHTEPYVSSVTLSEAKETAYWLVADAYCNSAEIIIKEAK